jgi:hypothetical protein
MKTILDSCLHSTEKEKVQLPEMLTCICVYTRSPVHAHKEGNCQQNSDGG